VIALCDTRKRIHKYSKITIEEKLLNIQKYIHKYPHGVALTMTSKEPLMMSTVAIKKEDGSFVPMLSH